MTILLNLHRVMSFLHDLTLQAKAADAAGCVNPREIYDVINIAIAKDIDWNVVRACKASNLSIMIMVFPENT